MSNQALVSVVIPTFNRAYCLPDTLASVFAQSHQNLEVWVVDDGSTDDTERVLKERWPGEPRLHYVRQQNAGVSAARNNGLSHATARYVALLDSDDLWLPWKVEAQLASLERFPEAVASHTEMVAIDENDRLLENNYLRAIYEGYQWFSIHELYPVSCALGDLLPEFPPELRDVRVRLGDLFSHSLTGNLMHTSTLMLVRPESGELERYDASLRTEETFDYHLRVAQRGPIAFVDAPALRYRRGRTDHLWVPGTYPPEKMLEFCERFLRVIEPHIRAGGSRMRVSHQALEQALARAHAWIAESALKTGRRGQMLVHLAASLRHQPWQPRLTARLAFRSVMPRSGG